MTFSITAKNSVGLVVAAAWEADVGHNLRPARVLRQGFFLSIKEKIFVFLGLEPSIFFYNLYISLCCMCQTLLPFSLVL